MSTVALRDVKVVVPEQYAWAEGCGCCESGLVNAPDLIPVDSLLMERLGQHKLGMLEFCACPAGMNYRARLENYERMLVSEAKRHPLMGEHAKRDSHRDIDAVMNLIVKNLPAPTMHYESGRERTEQLYEYAHR